MDSGELDVYSTCREEFARAAALFAPAADIFADADEADDMFGDGFSAAKQVRPIATACLHAPFVKHAAGIHISGARSVP